MLDPYVFIHGYLFFFNSKPAKVSGKKRLYHVTFWIFSYCNIPNNICSLQILFTDDYNRVVLETMDREPDSDYVNASYIDVSSSYYIKDRTLIIYSTNIISNVPFWSRICITANKCTYLLQYITFTQWSQQQIVPQNCYFFFKCSFRAPATNRPPQRRRLDWLMISLRSQQVRGWRRLVVAFCGLRPASYVDRLCCVCVCLYSREFKCNT